MFACKTENRAPVGCKTEAVLPGGAAGHKPFGRSCAAKPDGHGEALNYPRVCMARRRLATGRYDSDRLLDIVLDRIIEDLRL